MSTITRSDMGWPVTKANYANTNTGIVIHYDSVRDRVSESKPCWECRNYWAWCRQFHMGPTRRWKDVGYAYFVCPHGNLYVGRGYNKEQAAQPGGNHTWTSVTTALGPGEIPSDKQIDGIRRLRRNLMKQGMKAAIRGHSDFWNTQCPGTVLVEMIRNGTFAKSPSDNKPGENMQDMPLLERGTSLKWDVKTVRSLLYARGKVAVRQDEAEWLENWLDTTAFNEELETRVIEFQKDSFPNDEDEWDGVVGPKTWGKLLRR